MPRPSVRPPWLRPYPAFSCRRKECSETPTSRGAAPTNGCLLARQRRLSPLSAPANAGKQSGLNPQLSWASSFPCFADQIFRQLAGSRCPEVPNSGEIGRHIKGLAEQNALQAFDRLTIEAPTMGKRPPFQGLVKRLRDVFQRDRSHSTTIMVLLVISSKHFPPYPIPLTKPRAFAFLDQPSATAPVRLPSARTPRHLQMRRRLPAHKVKMVLN